MRNTNYVTMKKSLFTLPILITMAISTIAGEYEKAMMKNLESMSKAESLGDWQAIANNFARIGEAETDKWLPNYYACYSYVIMSAIETDGAKKDGYLDQGQSYLDPIVEAHPENSEIVSLQGFLHTMRLVVDPPSRGPQYSGMAFQSLNAALKYNPDNPRALYMLAQMQYGSAQFFGASTAEACSTLAKALEKFESFEPASDIAPQWGKRQATDLQAGCQ